MDFEDMKRIWDSQNNETLYAINETALYAQIKRKGKSVTRLLNFFEGAMIAVNLIVALVLLVDVVRDSGATYDYILPLLYMAFAIYGCIRRLIRQKEVVQFEQTMVGELDKAIWQIDYLIKQGETITLWYVCPLAVVAAVLIYLNGNLFWAIGVLVTALPLSYFGTRWENNKWHLPKRKRLEKLRQQITSPSA